MTKMQVLPKGREQGDMLRFAVAPVPFVRVGVIGLGIRGARAIERFAALEGMEVAALGDVITDHVDKAQVLLKAQGKREAKRYTGTDGWRRLCEMEEIDLIYICTDWKSHAPMAVYAMECGKHVAVEVPAATTVEECWQLVDTAERCRRHCMMLENCCYDFFELNTLNLVQKGLLGEVIHGEGGYIHDLRSIIFADYANGGYVDAWQMKYAAEHTGNPYPTHGLGPICQAMNIHRGDRMRYLVSMSTGQFGMTQYATERFGRESPEAMRNYLLGDMNTTLISTERGRTIMLQHNKSNPRPYSRIHLLNGTRGYLQKYPSEQLFLEAEGNKLLDEKEIGALLMKYEHPFVNRLGKRAVEVAGIRARDYIMDYRLIYCLQNGLPLDQDVYDAAEWSCLMELTEQSVRNRSQAVDVPDFTRGRWAKLSALEFSE